MKTYTDLEQSKKLVEILPLESADMTYYACVKDWRGNPVEPKWRKPANLTKEELALPCSNFQVYEYVPCWSLTALLDIIPKYIKGNSVLRIDIGEKDFAIWYDEIGFGVNNDLPDITTEYAIDACYEMIIKLKEQNLL